jgi:hypothetical protein
MAQGIGNKSSAPRSNSRIMHGLRQTKGQHYPGFTRPYEEMGEDRPLLMSPVAGDFCASVQEELIVFGCGGLTMAKVGLVTRISSNRSCPDNSAVVVCLSQTEMTKARWCSVLKGPCKPQDERGDKRLL